MNTILLHTGHLPDCILQFGYLQANYQTEYYCFATDRPITRLNTTILLPTGPLQGGKLLFCYPNATTRLYTSVLLPTCPLPNCIHLFCYPQACYQTAYYCSTTHMSTTRLSATVLLPTGPLPDCIIQFCFPQAPCQTVY